MSLSMFLVEAVLISLSGVMAPGPMTAVAVGKGSENPYAGVWMAAGHAVVEVPLMISVLYGVGYVLDSPHVQAVIALVGGLFLLVMGVGMFRSIGKSERGANHYAGSPVMAGVLLSIGNPYFLVWWATVGAALVLRSIHFGLLGFAAFAMLHSSCDFIWCSLLSALSFRGRRSLGQRFQQVVFSVCGVLLMFFSGKLGVDAARLLLAH